jgi:hypothetical protein
VVVVVASVAVSAIFLSRAWGNGIETAVVTDPTLHPPPSTTTTLPEDFGDPLPPVAVPDPLDTLVFIDTANELIRPVPIDAHPIGIVVEP